MSCPSAVKVTRTEQCCQNQDVTKTVKFERFNPLVLTHWPQQKFRKKRGAPLTQQGCHLLTPFSVLLTNYGRPALTDFAEAQFFKGSSWKIPDSRSGKGGARKKWCWLVLFIIHLLPQKRALSELYLSAEACFGSSFGTCLCWKRGRCWPMATGEVRNCWDRVNLVINISLVRISVWFLQNTQLQFIKRRFSSVAIYWRALEAVKICLFVCGLRLQGFKLTGMDVRVLLHVGLLVESLAAVLARVRPGVTVDQQMGR